MTKQVINDTSFEEKMNQKLYEAESHIRKAKKDLLKAEKNIIDHIKDCERILRQ